MSVKVITQTIIVVALAVATTIYLHNHAIENNVSWEDSIHNPNNWEFVEECAFNLNKTAKEVTQKDFNNRYLNN